MTPSLLQPLKTYSATTESFRVPLILDSMQCQQNITPRMTSQKLPLYGKDYLRVKTYGRTAQATQCAKSRKLAKVIDTIISIGTLGQQCFLLKGVFHS